MSCKNDPNCGPRLLSHSVSSLSELSLSEVSWARAAERELRVLERRPLGGILAVDSVRLTTCVSGRGRDLCTLLPRWRTRSLRDSQQYNDARTYKTMDRSPGRTRVR